MEYLWEEGLERKEYPKLVQDRDVDILVIGGGMAGILTAYFLKQAGRKPVVIEAKAIGTGATRGTTAVLSAQHDTIYTDFEKKYGRDYAKGYLKANLWAVEKFRELAKDIDCDFENAPSYMYSRTDGNKMRHEVELLNAMGYFAEFCDEIPLPIEVKGAVKYPDMAQFHPLKFLYGIAKDLEIYEHTAVTKIKGNVVYCENCTIRAKKIVIATHYPIIPFRGMYFTKMYQKKSYVMALEGCEKLDGTLVDDVDNGMFFRNYGDLLIIGGGDHRTGCKGGGFNELETFVKKHYPKAKVVYTWTNQDCVSLDGAPYIGTYCKTIPDTYVCAGFNLWGMTSSMISAKILADKITGIKNEFEFVFNPTRSIWHKQLALNLLTYIGNILLPLPKRCTHMGCALKWNKKQKVYECSCHGSCYDKNGGIIFSPAKKNLHIKENSN